MADAGKGCAGSKQMSPFPEGKGSGLITADCTAHHFPGIRGDTGGNVHRDDIGSKVPAETIEGMDSIRCFPGQVP